MLYMYFNITVYFKTYHKWVNHSTTDTKMGDSDSGIGVGIGAGSEFDQFGAGVGIGINFFFTTGIGIGIGIRIMDWNRNRSRNRALWNQSMTPELLLFFTAVPPILLYVFQYQTCFKYQNILLIITILNY